jgi:hypothetical protein
VDVRVELEHAQAAAYAGAGYEREDPSQDQDGKPGGDARQMLTDRVLQIRCDCREFHHCLLAGSAPTVIRLLADQGALENGGPAMRVSARGECTNRGTAAGRPVHALDADGIARYALEAPTWSRCPWDEPGPRLARLPGAEAG